MSDYLEMPVLELSLKRLARQVAGRLILDNNEVERVLEELFNNFVKSGKLVSIIQTEAQKALEEQVRGAFQTWDVKQAITESIKRMFKYDPNSQG